MVGLMPIHYKVLVIFVTSNLFGEFSLLCPITPNLIMTVITHFWLIPQIHFLFFKKKSRNKIKTSETEKTGQGGSQTDGKIKLQF
jgi:hypothetical protein